jgi:hypothetical protein
MLGTAWNLSQGLQGFFDAALPLAARKTQREAMFAGAVMQHNVCGNFGSHLQCCFVSAAARLKWRECARVEVPR